MALAEASSREMGVPSSGTLLLAFPRPIGIVDEREARPLAEPLWEPSSQARIQHDAAASARRRLLLTTEACRRLLLQAPTTIGRPRLGIKGPDPRPDGAQTVISAISFLYNECLTWFHLAEA